MDHLACGGEDAIFKLGELVRFVSSREIEIDAIPAAQTLATETVCAIEDAFPRSVLLNQIHLLVHVVEEIAICGVVHARWIFFLERFLKTLKDFVQLRSQPKACMAEGWIVREAFVYISEYLAQVDPLMPHMWLDEEDSRTTSYLTSGKEKLLNMDMNLSRVVDNLCILNEKIMTKSVDLWTVAKSRRLQERETWKQAHGGRRVPPVPRHLACFPHLISTEWIHERMTEEKAYGEDITNQEWEYARGCVPKCLSFHSMWSKGRHFRTRHFDESRTTMDCAIKPGTAELLKGY
ncbi:hypothetical protein GOP47_0020442 [Adiantum capillus-veneris]|uniref:DUF4218 domain-containing protein n=1 Tax=Adiantum capillus-veneris TaxID=13818 RepID=A0A9D4UDI1_ADICA|nr:hypothetical protein GOP47_0020442 [Adiantum capillus-veneris]